jgi:hypothetical protein
VYIVAGQQFNHWHDAKKRAVQLLGRGGEKWIEEIVTLEGKIFKRGLVINLGDSHSSTKEVS